MFLELDWTALIQLVNFAIFFAILNVVFLRPVGRALQARREYIEGVQHDYEQFTRDARALRAEAEAKRAAARREADERVGAARAEAEKQAASVAGDYAAKAEAIAAEARATVAAEMTKARAREHELAAALGAELLERAVGGVR